MSQVSLVKNLLAHIGDASLIPGSGRSPGGGNGNPLQYSCLDNRMDGGAWQATVHGLAKCWRDWATEHIHPCTCYSELIWIMFIASLLTIAKTWKQPKCLSADNWLKMWSVCVCTDIHTQSEILLSYKEWNTDICSTVNRPREYYT